MASVSPQHRSPFSASPYGFPNDEYEDFNDTEQLSSGRSNSNSICLVPSPASGSLASYCIISHPQHSPGDPSPSPPTMPLLYHDPGFDLGFPLGIEGLHDHTTFPEQSHNTSAVPATTASLNDSNHFLSPESFYNIPTTYPSCPIGTEHSPTRDGSSLMSSFSHNVHLNAPQAFPFHQGQHELERLQQPELQQSPHQPLQHQFNDAPTPQAGSGTNPWPFSDFHPGDQSPGPTQDTPCSTSPYISSSSCSSSVRRSSPGSPTDQCERKRQVSPTKVHGVKSGRIEKNKRKQPAGLEESQFVIVTPSAMSAANGKPNRWECLEAGRMTQRGRKGPLTETSKETARKVRQRGACFCCRIRKVKCGEERPCKTCKKLALAVPQVICWQFEDFNTVLFPDFIRTHFKKDQMASWISENVAPLAAVPGQYRQPVEVELFSGVRFAAVLKVPAKLFSPKTREVQQHLHMLPGQDRMDLQVCWTAPLALDADTKTAKDMMKERAKDYIRDLALDPVCADQVTETCKTGLPRQILAIAQAYANRTGEPIVTKALSVYSAHYIMTRHLCLTPRTISILQQTNFLHGSDNFMTSRVLNRQIKALIDEFLIQSVQDLFYDFTKSLKSKSRHEWAPCLAAFLVLCLFMETVETTVDTFVVARNERSIQQHCAPEFKRDLALSINREVENLPFKQFAFQFHQVYQTHAREAAARDGSSKAYNPLVDDALAQELKQDNDAAYEMVCGLQQLLKDRTELRSLINPILTAPEDHPYPRDVSQDYTGRLIARFLLSFIDPNYIFHDVP
ncbi:hypothetical protein SODALDRAFT_24340 [Sodiomyces alkalinus F11]|uniref:Zn(2)-C6 fungal-type domain-containing protein n=1 Tax=Sodiomyces alkalinus (strain CBS 110278 / VKM F-3762 / F11) TaxID=1314773 RepID=A0A3N2Q7Q4_SODAK|nr:hypothetical protein SODALDRAFT_24340 [Sodiomyces alkalinus F11]ROT42809.1 hypothetical protein SODALDRAFT_24340 [Sodiomyces alkalinus F11]